MKPTALTSVLSLARIREFGKSCAPLDRSDDIARSPGHDAEIDVLQCSSDGTFPIVAGYWAFFQFNREIKMRNLILAVCCAALVGSLSFVGGMSVASAQTTGPAKQETMKATDPMNAKAKTTKKKHKAKKAMTKSDGGTPKDTK